MQGLQEGIPPIKCNRSVLGFMLRPHYLLQNIANAPLRGLLTLKAVDDI